MDASLPNTRRCIQIHKRMGRLQQFRTYMLDNRRQQLNVDLAAPVNFTEAYQGFIAQVCHWPCNL